MIRMDMKQVAQAVNVLGRFCGVRDVAELTPAALRGRFGFERADAMVLFGGSILAGGDVLADAMRIGVADRYVIVGGAGHTTDTLRQVVADACPDVETAGRTEAEIFQGYLRTVHGLEADFLETASTNCGNNIIYLLDLLAREGVPCDRVILTQDATMQRRMDAGMRKFSPATTVVNYAAYSVEAVAGESACGGLTFAGDVPRGMWNMNRYINLLMGEIPRLTDDVQGYGPAGAGYIAHVDMPAEVAAAYELLRDEYGAAARVANSAFAS